MKKAGTKRARNSRAKTKLVSVRFALFVQAIRKSSISLIQRAVKKVKGMRIRK